MEAADWRTNLQAYSRQKIVHKIMEALKGRLPLSGQQGLQQVEKIAARFEEKIYTEATSQSDYQSKIISKMLTVENKFPNPMPNTAQSNAAGNSQNSPYPASQGMQSQVNNNQGQLPPFPVPNNQSQAGQQLLAQNNIHNKVASTGVQGPSSLNSGLPPPSSLSQSSMLNVGGQNSNTQNIQNISGVPQSSLGNSMMGEGVPSNIYANSQRQMQGRQQPGVPQQQQQQQQQQPQLQLQQSQNSQQFLSHNQKQQLHHQPLKRKFQQGNILHSEMQSLMQQQQQQQQNNNLLQQSSQLQSSQQSVMQPPVMQSSSLSGLQQNHQQPSVQQSTQSVIQQQDSTAGNAYDGDWQEEVHQKIKSMKEMYFVELSELYQNISGRLQQHDSLPQRLMNGQLDKFKMFKVMLERFMSFLQLSKSQILPAFKDKLSLYEKQIINALNSNRPRKPVSSMQAMQGLPPPHMHSVKQSQQLQSQMNQMQPTHETQMNPQIQSVNTICDSVLSGLQQNHQHPSVQRSTQLVIQQQDSSAGNANGGDWQEEVYQKIKSMKEMYFVELSELYQTISDKLQQHDSLPQQLMKEQLDKFKMFKAMLERFMSFLQLSKSQILPAFKDKLASYEKQIINALNSNRPQKPVSSTQPMQGLSPPHMHSMQQSQQAQSQMNQMQRTHENQMNPQIQLMNLQSSVPTMQQNSMTSLQHNSMPPLSGASEVNSGVSSLSNAGHQQTGGALVGPTQSLAIGAPGIPASPLLSEFASPDGNHGNGTADVSGKSDFTEQPLERLLKVVKSMSLQALSVSVSDIESVVSMIDRIAVSAPGNGSRAAVGEDLVAMTSCLQARNFLTQDGTNSGIKKIKRYTSAMPLNVVSSAGGINDSFRKPRFEANHALLEEIREINQQLIDTVVDISDEDIDLTAAAVASDGCEGTIVKCSFNAVTLSPNLKSQYTSSQMSLIQPLRLLVPTNYPNCSPILLNKFSVEAREYEDLSVKAKSRFNVSLRGLLEPISLGEIARTWDICARTVISEYAQQSDGCSFSSLYGTWENCLRAPPV